MKPNDTKVKNIVEIPKENFDMIISAQIKRKQSKKVDRSNKISRTKKSRASTLVQKINLNQTHKVTTPTQTLVRVGKLKFIQSEFDNEKEFHRPIIRLNKKPTEQELYACNRGYIKGKTSTFNFLKQLFCNKEHCEHCGRDYSLSHNRRVSSALKYAQHINCMTYIVITTPPLLRNILITKKRLQEFRRYWVRKFKRLGFKNGIIRYHWAGDDGKFYAPHLNVLVEGVFMRPELLDQIKKEYQQMLWNNYKIKLSDVPVIHHCGYSRNQGKKAHWLAYITRATWKDPDNLFINNLIKGFRNNIKWGVWDFTGKEKQTEQNNICSITGEKIVWQSPKNGGFLDTKKGKIIIKKGAKKLPLGIFRYLYEFTPIYTFIDGFTAEIISPLKIPLQKFCKQKFYSLNL